MMKIAIIDYEVGNLANVYNAWKRLGIEAAITRDPAVIRDADLVELPGVGAIRDAMGNLQKFDLIPLLQEQVQSGKFFMGVCLGMQALFEKSYEGGTYDCLGFLPGDIVPFHTKLKVPHMGWNICGKDNVLGFQFHPEKSGRVGEQLLRNVVDYVMKKG